MIPRSLLLREESKPIFKAATKAVEMAIEEGEEDISL